PTCAEPSNIRCSKRCAKPCLPGGSCREPTLYQRFTATIGAEWSGAPTTRSPLPRENCSTGQANPPAAAWAVPSLVAVAPAVVMCAEFATRAPNPRSLKSAWAVLGQHKGRGEANGVGMGIIRRGHRSPGECEESGEAPWA